MSPMDNLHKSIESLQPCEFECWGEKVGGSIKTWKKRYFVLKDKMIWYYASRHDLIAKGCVEIQKGTSVEDVSGKRIAKNKPNALSVGVTSVKGSRLFIVVCENSSDFQKLFEQLKKATQVEPLATIPRVVPTSKIPTTLVPTMGESPILQRALVASYKSNAFGWDNVKKVKNSIVYIKKDPDLSKYWQFWLDQLPSKKSPNSPPLPLGSVVEYTVVVSSSTENTKWIACGTQAAMIKPVVDFFVGVGSPDVEIDAIDCFGETLVPDQMGNWIEVSNNSGMAEGWMFSGDFDVTVIKKFVDGAAAEKLRTWLLDSKVSKFIQVGREMGENPPRQNVFTFALGGEARGQVERIQGLMKRFEFPELPGSIVSVMTNLNSFYGNIVIELTLSNEGASRVRVMIPEPTDDIAMAMLDAIGTKTSGKQVHLGLMKDRTYSIRYVEYSYLKKGFGHNVFLEGQDVSVHYFLGSDQ
ncbi:hypothetical protein EIN_249190 [Entamoeba invadens IP1]|uniref:PH domain-containing protein n=1 Tax=Entamoeba invadens IP1 TaxID=370355 RepID=A0A0A1UE67_ENTIV|nr:hypothetical protein EIN_249190 [Entamoeba invadens IP1]ELP94885.1 hypothetical protein EIN_249190 [Entamoeba invadens IP1]|eukprot:XP_004261656.1 hypothetical protein EIN_249190 [Entamoeba invadens IP1]